MRDANRLETLCRERLLAFLSVEELKKSGLSERHISGMASDRFQTRESDERGYLGALVLNYLSRESSSLNGSLDDIFVPAYTFSRLITRDLTDLLEIKHEGRPVVIKQVIDGEEDLYIAVKDLHLITDSGDKTSPLTDLATTYHHSHNRVIRDNILRRTQNMVKAIATTYYGRVKKRVLIEDLVSDGNWGLLDAVEKFNPAAGASFETYAYRRITGSILDGLRELDMMPRNTRRNYRSMVRFKDDYYKKHEREPTQHEYREAWIDSGRSEESFDDFCSQNALTFTITRLDASLPGHEEDESTLLDFLPDVSLKHPLSQLLDRELIEQVLLDLMELPECYQPALGAYILEQMPLAEVCGLADVSESRMSQIATQYLKSPQYFKRTKEHLGIKTVVDLRIPLKSLH